MASRDTSIPNFRRLVAERLGGLSLDGDDEAGIIEELASELEERWREAVSQPETGDPNTVARLLSEVDWSALRREIPRSVRPWSAWVLERTPKLARTRLGRLALEVATDLRATARGYRRPGAARVWTAAAALAVGIGVGTSVMSVAYGALSRALPVPDPQRLLWLWETRGENPAPAIPLSASEYLALKKSSREHFDLAAYHFMTLARTDITPAESFDSALVDGDFFSVLGAKPQLGRTIEPNDIRSRGRRVAVLSETAWRQRFKASPQIVGTSIEWNHEPVTVIGVMPREFRYPAWAELWLSARFRAPEPFAYSQDVPAADFEHHYLRVIARLAPTTNLLAVRRFLSTLNPGPEAHTVHAQALRENLRSRMRGTVTPLIQGVSLVLLVAAVCVGNLLLASALSRRRELSIRAAVGASRFRLARQLTLESLVLAGIACGGGLLIAQVGVRAILAVGGSLFAAPMSQQLDPAALAFAFGSSLVSGLGFGLSLVESVSGSRTAGALRGERGRWARLFRGQGRSAFLIGSVAACAVVVLGASLLVRSFVDAVRTPLGFGVDRLLTFAVYPAGPAYFEKAARADIARRIEREIETLPGVLAVGVASEIPLEPEDTPGRISFEGLPRGEPPVTVELLSASPGFFDAMGIEISGGRTFHSDDSSTEPVVLVNQRLARLLAPNRSILGRKIRFEDVGEAEEIEPWRKIVGIVAETRMSGLASEPRPEVYLPFAEHPASEMIFAVRTEGDPKKWIGLAKDAVAEVAADVPTKAMRSGRELLAGEVAEGRFLLVFLLGFAAICFLLTAAGLFAVMASWVVEREREIAVRLALGAAPSSVFRWILRAGLSRVAIGVGLGLCVCFVTPLGNGREVSLFGVSPFDPSALAATLVFMATLGFAACYVPARRATAVDPIAVLKS